MYGFRLKKIVVVGILAGVLTMLAIVARPSVQKADADTPNPIQKRNMQLQDAYRLAEGR
ncbi:MAG: hypothetical protein HN350_05130 [Phycisphaerales bacterium]|jgi:hypothetical protein|nr:hypothetical protein [Phycisphaerales bacterium]